MHHVLVSAALDEAATIRRAEREASASAAPRANDISVKMNFRHLRFPVP